MKGMNHRLEKVEEPVADFNRWRERGVGAICVYPSLPHSLADYQTANIAAQFQDIAVTSAMGMSASYQLDFVVILIFLRNRIHCTAPLKSRYAVCSRSHQRCAVGSSWTISYVLGAIRCERRNRN